MCCHKFKIPQMSGTTQCFNFDKFHKLKENFLSGPHCVAKIEHPHAQDCAEDDDLPTTRLSQPSPAVCVPKISQPRWVFCFRSPIHTTNSGLCAFSCTLPVTNGAFLIDCCAGAGVCLRGHSQSFSCVQKWDLQAANFEVPTYAPLINRLCSRLTC